MNFRKLFLTYQKRISSINEVSKTEKTIKFLHNCLKVMSKELKKYVILIGCITWACEKQGFNGDLIVAREIS